MTNGTPGNLTNIMPEESGKISLPVLQDGEQSDPLQISTSQWK